MAPQVPVTLRAVVQRINRALKPDGEQLKATRGERAKMDLGYYFILNFRDNIAYHTNVDPEALARELGVLKPHEYVVE